MRTRLLSIFMFTLIGNLIPLYANTPVTGRTTFMPRPMATNAARTIGAVSPYRDLCCHDHVYGYTTLTTSYTHSLRANRMGHALFSPNCVTISGSQVTARCTNELLADYFGLSPTFASEACFKPRIQNALATIDSYIGLDPVLCGLYFTLQIPIGYTRWQMNIEENLLTNDLDTPFAAGYMDFNETAPAIQSFTCAFNGNVRFGQMQDPYKYGLINGAQSHTGVADIYLALGWNPWVRPDRFLGFSIRTTIPTGSHINGTYMFEPILGNGRHVELGIGLDGRIRVWEKLGEQEISIRAFGNFMHQFRAKQRRSFDLGCNNFGSRFILLKEFDALGNYTGNLTPAINHTTLDCNVRANMYADMVVMAYYTYNNIETDFGYNGFIRSREKISLEEGIPAKRYGFKGIQNVATTFPPIVLLNTTESTATLFETPPGMADDPSPVFISTADINTNSACSPLIVTHKFFADISYGWDTCHTHPFFALGGEIEVEGINTRNTVRYQRTTLSQWGLWLKGGISFG